MTIAKVDGRRASWDPPSAVKYNDRAHWDPPSAVKYSDRAHWDPPSAVKYNDPAHWDPPSAVKYNDRLLPTRPEGFPKTSGSRGSQKMQSVYRELIRDCSSLGQPPKFISGALGPTTTLGEVQIDESSIL